jgi:ABC-type branched-subunit amino acid transport system substrate-binding protein
MTAARRGWFVAAASALALHSTSAGAQPLTALEQAGKKVYVEGVSPGGRPLKALVGVQGTPFEGSTLPCVNCHGADGLGRPEGAIKPSSVRWSDMTKPYGQRRDDGRVVPPYDERTFADSLTYGKDPGGVRLDIAMPRYIMAHEDIAALVAYLKRIETDYDPGLSADRLRLGTLLPSAGRLGEAGQAMAAVLRAQVASLNDKGGLFGRKVELVIAEYSEDRVRSLANAERLFGEQQVFAVVSPFTSGIEREVGALAERLGVPVVGPFTLRTQLAPDVNRQTFFVLAGLGEQVRVLAEFATRRLQLVDPVVAVLHPDDDEMQPIARIAVEAFHERGWARARAVPYPPGRFAARQTVARLQQDGVRLVLFLGSDAELEQLGAQMRDAIWSPYLLAPGVRVARAASALPSTMGERIFLAYPTQPGDVTPAGAAALAAAQRGSGPGGHLPAQVSAYAAMRVLEEGLKRAGRDLSRARLVAALENLFSYETMVTPAISYGPSRRVGALGGYVVVADPSSRTLRPVGGYIRVD